MSERIDAWYDDLYNELPLLPGEVGVAVLEVTEVYERIEFPDLTPESAAQEPQTYAGWTKAELYAQAKEIGLKGRSRMTKGQLRSALLAG